MSKEQVPKDMITEVPGFSGGAKVIKFPTQESSADSEQTDGENQADIVPLQKPIIDHVPSVEELHLKDKR